MFEEHKLESINRAVLVGLNSPALDREENATEETLEELNALLETAGGTCMGMVMQNRATPEPRTFIGEGKVEEVKGWWAALGRTSSSLTTPCPPPSSGCSPRRWG